MPAHGDHHQSPIRNGVDTAQVYGTLDALTDQPKLARFEFRATNHWIDGTRLTGATFGACMAARPVAEPSGHAGAVTGLAVEQSDRSPVTMPAETCSSCRTGISTTSGRRPALRGTEGAGVGRDRVGQRPPRQ